LTLWKWKTNPWSTITLRKHQKLTILDIHMLSDMTEQSILLLYTELALGLKLSYF